MIRGGGKKRGGDRVIRGKSIALLNKSDGKEDIKSLAKIYTWKK